MARATDNYGYNIYGSFEAPVGVCIRTAAVAAAATAPSGWGDPSNALYWNTSFFFSFLSFFFLCAPPFFVFLFILPSNLNPFCIFMMMIDRAALLFISYSFGHPFRPHHLLCFRQSAQISGVCPSLYDEIYCIKDYFLKKFCALGIRTNVRP